MKVGDKVPCEGCGIETHELYKNDPESVLLIYKCPHTKMVYYQGLTLDNPRDHSFTPPEEELTKSDIVKQISDFLGIPVENIILEKQPIDSLRGYPELEQKARKAAEDLVKQYQNSKKEGDDSI